MPLSSKAPAPETRYTVFVRVPFPRGEFVDPPAAHWNSSKDRSLWKILSSASKGSEIDWHQLAEEFDVSLPFLLQQAAWLYESHFSQVREQLRKVSRPVSASGSPAPQSNPGSTTTVGQGGLSMKRGGSSGASRAQSSMSFRAARDSPTYRSEGSGPGTPVPQRIYAGSRTSSTNTILQVHKNNSNSQLGRRISPKTSRRSLETDRQTPPLNPSDSRRLSYDAQPGSPLRAAADSSSESSSSDDDIPTTMARSRAFTRRPRYTTARSKAPLGLLASADEYEDDEDDSPALLFSHQPRPVILTQAAHPRSPVLPQDTTPAATTATQRLARRTSSTPTPTPNTPPPLPHHKQHREGMFSQDAPPSPISPSSGSPRPTARPSSTSTSQHTNPGPAPFLSPRQRTTLGTKDGSSGSPSMGSSFSDLDDASVTQSALEEALVRDMGRGGSSIGFNGPSAGGGNGGTAGGNGEAKRISLVGRVQGVVGKASRYL